MIENDSTGYEGAYQSRGEQRKRWYAGKLEKNEASVNLRFDFEANNEWSIEQRNESFLSSLKTDLEDLIVNGDVTQSDDALLKAFSGEKVRGQKAVGFVVLGAHLEKEYKEKKMTTEYTLFLRPYVRFE